MNEYIVRRDEMGEDLERFVCCGDLIRCRDCKRNKSDKWVDCPITEMYGRTTDNYCSLAERRDE